MIIVYLFTYDVNGLGIFISSTVLGEICNFKLHHYFLKRHYQPQKWGLLFIQTWLFCKTLELMSYDDVKSLEQSMSPARPQRDLSGALSLTIEGITLIGNIFPILVVTWIKKSSKKTVTDILICALALTDIFAVLAPLPVSLPTFICQDHWKKGPAACHYYQFCVFWLQNVASLLVIAMSVERVMALAMPLR